MLEFTTVFQRQIDYQFQSTWSCSKEKHWKYFKQLQIVFRTCVQTFLDHSKRYIKVRQNVCHLFLQSPGLCLVAAYLTSAQGRVGIFNLQPASKL